MSHWYDKDGKPQHFVKAKNGNMRDSTLRDAKKNGWYPSVSGIIGILAKPGLETWKQNQILEACWNVGYLPANSFEEWSSEVKELAAENSTRARDRGTEIHDSIERYLKTREKDDNWKYVTEVVYSIEDTFNTAIIHAEAEVTFASQEGYGGMIDYIERGYEGKGLLIDYKTKDKEFTDKDKLAWPDHGMQLAAYRHGMGMDDAVCANVFISPNANIRIEVWEEEELNRLFNRFMKLLGLWKDINL